VNPIWPGAVADSSMMMEEGGVGGRRSKKRKRTQIELKAEKCSSRSAHNFIFSFLILTASNPYQVVAVQILFW